MLFIIGLGLFDEKDVTVRGKELIDKAEFVYLESYTAILLCQKDKLEQFYGKEIIEADRNFVESQCDEMLERAQKADVAFLVVGDPFCATTHADLFLRAKEKGVTVRVVHNASVMSAVAACGLQLYRFGETVSLVFFEKGWRPESFYDKLKKNADSGLHSLCLLDIKVKEQTVENMMKSVRACMNVVKTFIHLHADAKASLRHALFNVGIALKRSEEELFIDYMQ